MGQRPPPTWKALAIFVSAGPVLSKGATDLYRVEPGMKLKELSADLAAAVARFEEREMGVRPAEVSVVVQKELVLVHIKGVLSRSERMLASTDDGQAVLQRFNRLLFSAGSEPSIRQQVSGRLGREVLDVQTTLAPLTGSLVVVFTLEEG